MSAPSINKNQLAELRKHVQARGWSAHEYTDRGISGTKDKRPGLDALIRDTKRRKLDVLVCWRLDRLGRGLKHLVTLLDELQVLGIAFVSLTEGIDATTPAGKLQMHILAAIAEFERARIAERVTAGLARARQQGRKLGRPERIVSEAILAPVRDLAVREAAKPRWPTCSSPSNTHTFAAVRSTTAGAFSWTSATRARF